MLARFILVCMQTRHLHNADASHHPRLWRFTEERSCQSHWCDHRLELTPWDHESSLIGAEGNSQAAMSLLASSRSKITLSCNLNSIFSSQGTMKLAQWSVASRLICSLRNKIRFFIYSNKIKLCSDNLHQWKRRRWIRAERWYSY